jgi:hypothetical protein
MVGSVTCEITSCQRLEECVDVAEHETNYGAAHITKIAISAQAKSPVASKQSAGRLYQPGTVASYAACNQYAPPL